MQKVPQGKKTKQNKTKKTDVKMLLSRETKKFSLSEKINKH